MSTISVPLTPKLEKYLDDIVTSTGSSRAAVMVEALERYSEDEAVNAILRASSVPSLRGDLDGLLEKID